MNADEIAKLTDDQMVAEHEEAKRHAARMQIALTKKGGEEQRLSPEEFKSWLSRARTAHQSSLANLTRFKAEKKRRNIEKNKTETLARRALYAQTSNLQIPDGPVSDRLLLQLAFGVLLRLSQETDFEEDEPAVKRAIEVHLTTPQIAQTPAGQSGTGADRLVTEMTDAELNERRALSGQVAEIDTERAARATELRKRLASLER